MPRVFKTAPVLSIAIMLFAGIAFSQSELEADLMAVQSRLSALRQEQRMLDATADSLAKQIQLLKEGEAHNFLGRRRLEGALREAQVLAARQEENQRAQTAQFDEEQRCARALDDMYTVLIDSLLRAVDRVTPAERRDLASRAKELRDHRAALQPLLLRNLAVPSYAPDLNLNSAVLPEDIKARADLLRDREDQLRRQLLQLERRSGQIRQESALRKKMADLVTDVSLFEQRDETAKLSLRSYGSVKVDGFDRGGEIGTAGVQQVEVDLALPAEPLLRTDLRTPSSGDADQLLREIDEQCRILRQRADSLANQARLFDAEAEKLRAILQQNR